MMLKLNHCVLYLIGKGHSIRSTVLINLILIMFTANKLTLNVYITKYYMYSLEKKKQSVNFDSLKLFIDDYQLCFFGNKLSI